MVSSSRFTELQKLSLLGKKLLWMFGTTTELQLLAAINKAVLTLKIKSNQWLMDVWRRIQGGEACIFPADHLLSSRHFSTHTDFWRQTSVRSVTRNAFFFS